jgi:hypothetical protein
MQRTITIAIVTAALFLAGGSPAYAKSGKKAAAPKPDATVSFEGGSVAAGIGYSWGSGTLHYKGKNYPLKVDGLSVGDVGISKVNASGNVYHLQKLEDFPGTFTAASAGATVGGGGGVAAMQNQNGVEIRAKATSQGLKLKLGADGVKIELAK